MPSLDALQRACAATLALGPSRFEPQLFDLPPDRALLALKAHANSISHARLVALEDSFPITRTALGEARFNALSRRFLDLPGVCREPLSHIGRALPAFLAASDISYPLVDLARAEWAWLIAYHAAEATPFDLAALAGLCEADLLATRVHCHPAARSLGLSGPAGEAFAPFGDVVGARILLFTRPEADVRVTATDLPTCGLLARLPAIGAGQPAPIGDLFACRLAEAPDEDPVAAFLALASAGAIALHRKAD
jgi:hypothetical protein